MSELQKQLDELESKITKYDSRFSYCTKREKSIRSTYTEYKRIGKKGPDDLEEDFQFFTRESTESFYKLHNALSELEKLKEQVAGMCSRVRSMVRTK